MTQLNTTPLSGAALAATARALARKHRNPHHSVYYRSGDTLRRIYCQSLEWSIGKPGDFGFCGSEPKLAFDNPGYIYLMQ